MDDRASQAVQGQCVQERGSRQRQRVLGSEQVPSQGLRAGTFEVTQLARAAREACLGSRRHEPLEQVPQRADRSARCWELAAGLRAAADYCVTRSQARLLCGPPSPGPRPSGLHSCSGGSG
ncbi:hypothetical protein HJG60_011032 [Phyllostomus discolor]|uniref:Uncharacterized protein n=1 Tax=Phyllostomus discolor TaxID=89673 RepID=A0A834EAF8_9CHIR|nr:hypothetical protein HJG60_011032 [Phyllostomus discolor]